eukprot:SAG25_NODE_7984_length_447_cov_0.951149_1_plen_40_part_01
MVGEPLTPNTPQLPGGLSVRGFMVRPVSPHPQLSAHENER